MNSSLHEQQRVPDTHGSRSKCPNVLYPQENIDEHSVSRVGLSFTLQYVPLCCHYSLVLLLSNSESHC